MTVNIASFQPTGRLEYRTIAPCAMSNDPTEQLVLPGAHNFRELGGMGARSGTTGHRLLMRCEALALAAGSHALPSLGVRTLLDLREPVERRIDPVEVASDRDLNVVQVPLLVDRIDTHT